jgi:hypothetical protein
MDGWMDGWIIIVIGTEAEKKVLESVLSKPILATNNFSTHLFCIKQKYSHGVSFGSKCNHVQSLYNIARSVR